jgi:hypothetical protein
MSRWPTVAVALGFAARPHTGASTIAPQRFPPRGEKTRR